MGNGQKSILFLCQFFYPEYNSSATLPFDTAKYLASQGYAVSALVGYPKEYSNEKDLPCRDVVDGVSIRRLRYLQLKRGGKIGRLINYFSFTFKALLSLGALNRVDCVVVYSNPPILPIVPIFGKKLFGTHFVFVAYDVYPEVAYASKSLSPGSIISRVMKQINCGLYRTCDCVVALTDEMRQFLLEKRPELTSDRIVTIANWAHESAQIPTRESYARFRYEEDAFIVAYFGNMGICQDMETMLGGAELLKDDAHVRFLIIGHGSKKEGVLERIRSAGLKNIQLLDFLTGEDFEHAVAISSCCVVSLERGLKGTCAPSKYYSYLQGGKPILAVVEKDSYLEKEVADADCGRAVMIGDSAGLRDHILELAEHPDLQKRMAEHSGALYKSNYGYEIAMKKYAAVFERLFSREAEQTENTVPTHGFHRNPAASGAVSSSHTKR